MKGIDTQRDNAQTSGKRTGGRGWLQSAPWSLLIVAWSALVFGQGGVDLGGIDTRGQTAALIAGVILVVLASTFVLTGRLSGALASRPGRFALGGALGLLVVSAASVSWASAPDLAWIDVNRLLMVVAATVVGIGAAPLVTDLTRPAIWLSLACVPIVAWALLSKILPELATAGAGARLHAPLSSFNALALVCGLALPGALCLTSADARQWPARIGTSLSMALVVVVVLTYSRSGAIAMVIAAGVLIALSLERPALLATLLAAAIGAAPAAAIGLTHHALTTDGLPVGDRRAAGALLGLALVVGAVLAVTLRPFVERLLASRSERWWPRAGSAVVAVVTFAVTAALASGGVSDAPVDNGSGHFETVSFNNRIGWWAEAIRGFASAPVVGHGAGSFPLVHLIERRDSSLVRSPHQLVLQIASDLGVVGLALLATMLVGTVWAVSRAGRTTGWPSVAPVVAVGAAFMFGAQVDVPWSIPLLFLPTFALAGLVIGRASRSTRVRRPSPGATSMVIVLTGTALVSLVLPVAARYALKRAEKSLVANPSSARADARIAEALNPFDIRAVTTRGSASRGLGDSPGRRSAGQEAISRQPENPLAWACLVSATDAPVASLARHTLARLNPRDPNQTSPPVHC